MAEFCRDCFLDMEGDDHFADKIILSRDPDICEGCGEWKRVVVDLRYRTLLDDIIDAVIDHRLKKQSRPPE